MKTTLVLVRHGESVGNVLGQMQGWYDAKLTPKGIRQAELLAAHLSSRTDISVLYSSPLQRAWVTASTIGKTLGMEPIPDPELREMNFGTGEGLTMEELSRQQPDLYRAWRSSDDAGFGWPGGETRRQFRGRVIRAIDNIRGRHPGQVIAIVAHGGTLSAYLSHTVARDPDRWRDYILDNCSLTEVDLDGSSLPVLKCLNELGHLSALEKEIIEDAASN